MLDLLGRIRRADPIIRDYGDPFIKGPGDVTIGVMVSVRCRPKHSITALSHDTQGCVRASNIEKWLAGGHGVHCGPSQCVGLLCGVGGGAHIALSTRILCGMQWHMVQHDGLLDCCLQGDLWAWMLYLPSGVTHLD